MTLTKQRMAMVFGNTVKPQPHHKKTRSNHKKHGQSTKKHGQTTKTFRDNSDLWFFYFYAVLSVLCVLCVCCVVCCVLFVVCVCVLCCVVLCCVVLCCVVLCCVVLCCVVLCCVVLCCVVLCCVVLCCVVLCCVVLCCVVLCCVVLCCVVLCCVVLCCVVLCCVVLCCVVLCCVVLCCVVVWCGVVWCGVVWCGVVWCGVVWCGVVWCGVLCCVVLCCVVVVLLCCCVVVLLCCCVVVLLCCCVVVLLCLLCCCVVVLLCRRCCVCCVLCVVCAGCVRGRGAVVVVACVVWHAENLPVCKFKTPLCVHSNVPVCTGCPTPLEKSNGIVQRASARASSDCAGLDGGSHEKSERGPTSSRRARPEEVRPDTFDAGFELPLEGEAPLAGHSKFEVGWYALVRPGDVVPRRAGTVELGLFAVIPLEDGAFVAVRCDAEVVFCNRGEEDRKDPHQLGQSEEAGIPPPWGLGDPPKRTRCAPDAPVPRCQRSSDGYFLRVNGAFGVG